MVSLLDTVTSESLATLITSSSGKSPTKTISKLVNSHYTISKWVKYELKGTVRNFIRFMHNAAKSNVSIYEPPRGKTNNVVSEQA